MLVGFAVRVTLSLEKKWDRTISCALYVLGKIECILFSSRENRTSFFSCNKLILSACEL